MKSKKHLLFFFVLTAITTVFLFQNCSTRGGNQPGDIVLKEASLSVPVDPSSFVPDAFGFNNVSNASLNTSVESNSVTMNGKAGNPVSATCEGCLVQKNGNGSYSQSLFVNSGDTVRIQLTSAASYSSQKSAVLRVGNVASTTWIVSTLAAPVSSCVSNVGSSCKKSVFQKVEGCPQDYGCSNFTGVYYNSPNGCDANTAGSFVEYYYDGQNTMGRSSNDRNPTVLGDASSVYHCTYIGFAPHDSFKNPGNGSCFNSSDAGFPIPNTYTIVVPGQGCSHDKAIEAAGTVQCDGSCR